MLRALSSLLLQHHRCWKHLHNGSETPPSKLQFIHDMLQSRSLTTSQMADTAECSERTIKNIRRNLQLFGSVHAPPNRVGRRQSLTPPMPEALCDHLLEKPGLYLDEMAIFLWDEFHILATTSSIRRALVSKGWSKKADQQKAKEQNAELREFYLHNLSSLNCIALFTLMNLDVINGLDSDGQAGLHSV